MPDQFCPSVINKKKPYEALDITTMKSIPNNRDRVLQNFPHMLGLNILQ